MSKRRLLDSADLIARLEKATRPDRVLDGMIFKLIEERPGDRWVDQFDDGVWHHECRDEPGAYIGPRYYTSSIDAALTLVPDKFGWSIHHLPEKNRYLAYCADHEEFGATPAIALCIAALRARAAIANGDSL